MDSLTFHRRIKKAHDRLDTQDSLVCPTLASHLFFLSFFCWYTNLQVDLKQIPLERAILALLLLA